MIIPAEPLFFHPHYEKKIWGGQRLSTLFGKPIPAESTIGESWELSAIAGAATKIACGSLTGVSLDTLYRTAPEMLVGNDAAARAREFPLLVKFIDAHDRLSVQVHPDDAFARELFGEPFGKAECWYIADAGVSGALAVGLKKAVTRTELHAAAENGTIGELLNIVKVKTGEVYFIPARTIHAILNDVVVYELQQSSDTTLRLYDWGRVDTSGEPRSLQVADAVSVADLTPRGSYLIEPLSLPGEGYLHSVRVACEHFALEEFYLEGTAGTVRLERRSSCRILTILEGTARLEWNSGQTVVPQGATVLLPAVMDAVGVSASGRCRFLMATVPDLPTEICKPLEETRCTSSRIAQLDGDRNTVSPGDR